jgi:GT2 family glycosyltransferase
MRIGVIIATAGRPGVVPTCVRNLAAQTEPAEQIIVVAPTEDDFGDLRHETIKGVTVITGPRGSSVQRNCGLALIEASCDVVVFFDDDFAPSRHWLAQLRRAMIKHPDLNVVTGRVLADGIHGPGFGWPEALGLVAAEDTTFETRSAGGMPPAFAITENVSAYGCNMAFRMTAIAGLRFDERLKLYGWQEDTDLSYRAKGSGRMARLDGIWGVHLGAKSGRSTGLKLGYAQIANPVYLLRKGTIPLAKALNLMGRNLMANAVKSPWPEPEVDRIGRLKGNLIALRDVVMRRDAPERVSEI